MRSHLCLFLSIYRSKSLTSWLPCDKHAMTATQILDTVPKETALQAMTVSEAISLFDASVAKDVTLSHPGLSLTQTAHEIIGSLSDLGVSHYQFNEKYVTTMFENMSSVVLGE